MFTFEGGGLERAYYPDNTLLYFNIIKYKSLLVGVFEITVRAMNPLDTVEWKIPEPFYVQVAPTTIKPDDVIDGWKKEAIVLGEMSTLSVTVATGTDVLCDWEMSDGTTYIGEGMPLSKNPPTDMHSVLLYISF